MKNHLNLRDSYSTYKEQVEEPIDIKTYMYIVNGFMKFLMYRLFRVGEITLPDKLGTLSIIGKKQKIKVEEGKIKGCSPDWKSTKELWENNPEAKANKQLVYHFNEETNGVRYKFFWAKKNVAMTNKTLYTLKLARNNKRLLSRLIKEGKEYLIKS